MTLEEINKEVKKIQDHYNSEMSRLQKEMQKAKDELYITWANENARFKIGDVIAYPHSDAIIRIERIGYGVTYGDKPYVTYYGPTLTKKLTIRKNGNLNFSMYDDGRDIVKL